MKYLFLSTLIFISSCSSLKKSIIYGGIAGSAIGVMGGKTLSPDTESVQPNMAIWGSVGALIGSALGYLFFVDDPENKELNSMILTKNNEESRKSKKDDYLNPKIIVGDSKKYKLETGPLPDHLKGKVKTPFIIEHEVPESVEQLDNGKTITVESHKAWEVSYE